MVKGVILHADLVISVSGIPLIGVNLRAAIAGMKTMLDYGMMEAWDEDIRKYALENSEEEAPLKENEEVVFKTFASYHHRDSSLPRSRSGYLYLTDKRLFFFRKKPARVLLEVALEDIKGLTIERKKHLRQEECLLLLIENDQSNRDLAYLSLKEAKKLKSMIEKLRISPPSTIKEQKQMLPH